MVLARSSLFFKTFLSLEKTGFCNTRCILSMQRNGKRLYYAFPSLETEFLILSSNRLFLQYGSTICNFRIFKNQGAANNKQREQFILVCMLSYIR